MLRRKAWDTTQRVFTRFATSSIVSSVIEADYIFIPCCIKDIHWVLYVFDMRSFQAIIMDSMADNPHYKEETEVMVCLFTLIMYSEYSWIMLQGFDITTMAPWSNDTVDNFR